MKRPTGIIWTVADASSYYPKTPVMVQTHWYGPQENVMIARSHSKTEENGRKNCLKQLKRLQAEIAKAVAIEELPT